MNTDDNIFDADDVRYLMLNLTRAQLRHEIRKAAIDESVANAYIGTEYETPADSFPYGDYKSACKSALDIQYADPILTPIAPGRINTEQVRNSVDIVGVVGCHTKLRKSGKNYYGCCPIHGDNNPSLAVYPETQSFYCFGCNRGGDVIAFMIALANLDFKQAVANLAGGVK